MIQSPETGLNGEEFLTRMAPFMDELKPGLLLRREAIAKLPDIRAIVFLGSSAVGKTTLVEFLRETSRHTSLLGQRPIDFPRRHVTRSPRDNDDMTENLPVTPDEFDAAITSGLLDVWWSRRIGNRPIERYGFEKRVKGARLAVYSGNNALLHSTEASAEELIARSLVYQVYAPLRVKQPRILGRSPDLDTDELAGRLADSGESILEDERVHGVLSMYDPYDDHAFDASMTTARVLNIDAEIELADNQ